MKNKTKYFLIGTILLTATAGSMVAIAGPGNCNQGEGGMFGKGPSGHMQGKQQMGPMQGINRLDNLTDEQQQQLSELRQSQQSLMQGKRDEMIAHRTAMKAQVDAILTEQQRETLANMGGSGFGGHARRGHHGG